MAWRGEVNTPRISQPLSDLDETPCGRADLGHPLGFGCMDHGASVEIAPIDLILLAMATALIAMWLDK